MIVVFVHAGLIITKLDWLTNAIGFLILVTGLGLFFAPKLSQMTSQRRSGPQLFKIPQFVLTLISGALLRACVSLTSLGAGALGSLLLIYLYPLRMTPHKLVATDIVHAIPLGLVAGLGYLIAGKVEEKDAHEFTGRLCSNGDHRESDNKKVLQSQLAITFRVHFCSSGPQTLCVTPTRINSPN